MLTFYATISYGKTDDNMPDIPWLLPASSWARGGLPKPKLPPNVRHTAADSGAWNGLFGRGAEEARRYMRRHNLTQKRYELDVALPRYLAKVEEALSQPKQLVLT